jgi:hypothetical protein
MILGMKQIIKKIFSNLKEDLKEILGKKRTSS